MAREKHVWTFRATRQHSGNIATINLSRPTFQPTISDFRNPKAIIMSEYSDKDFQKSSDEFLVWFKAQKGAQFHSNLKIVDLRDRDAGRGICKRGTGEHGL
jgi:hypothetical protein